MNHMPSREFQTNYQRLDEPVTVMARSRTLGTWYPKGTETFAPNGLDAGLAEITGLMAEIEYLKSELAKRLTTKVPPLAGFGHSTPAPKP